MAATTGNTACQDGARHGYHRLDLFSVCIWIVRDVAKIAYSGPRDMPFPRDIGCNTIALLVAERRTQMQADRVEVSWDDKKSSWLVRIETGEEVIRRHCKLPRDADDQVLTSAAHLMLTYVR